MVSGPGQASATTARYTSGSCQPGPYSPASISYTARGPWQRVSYGSELSPPFADLQYTCCRLGPYSPESSPCSELSLIADLQYTSCRMGLYSPESTSCRVRGSCTVSRELLICLQHSCSRCCRQGCTA
eukprot:1158963-Pelagomonas_calceolata.AAC.3